MRNLNLPLIISFVIIIGLNTNAVAQDVKKEATNNQAAKVQQAALVSIFQINFAEVNERLQQVLTKNETILHFRQEANTNTFALFLPSGNSKTDLINLLKSNEITQFEITRVQQGGRKANLFNKRF